MSKKTILIVEDDFLHMKLFNDILEHQGYKTVQATDGDTVLDLVRENNPDLILLDIRLPNWSGFDLVKLLKNEPSLKDIPVLAITALSMGRDDLLRQGFDGLLSKPIAIPNMLRTIAEFMAPIPSTVQ